MESNSTHSPTQFNASIRLTPTNNEKLFLSYALLTILFVLGILTGNIPENNQIPPLLLMLAISFLIFLLSFFIWILWQFYFSSRKKIVAILDDPISTKELLVRWKDFTHDELRMLLLYAKFQRYCQDPKDQWYEITKPYNCFTTGSKILESFAQPDSYLNLEEVIAFETISNFFQKIAPPQTEQARIIQLETQLKAADLRTIDVAHFMLKIVNDPSPIEKVTVPIYKLKFQELQKERAIPPANKGGLSQNFIIKELRPKLPKEFYNDKHSEK